MTLIYRTITIVGSSSLTAGNIKNGVTIFGVKGTFVGLVDSGWYNVFTGRNGNLEYGTYDRKDSTVIGGVYVWWHTYSGWSGWATMSVSFPSNFCTGISRLTFDGWVRYVPNGGGAIVITFGDGTEWTTGFNSDDCNYTQDDAGTGKYWHYGIEKSITTSRQLRWVNFDMNTTSQTMYWGVRCRIFKD